MRILLAEDEYSRTNSIIKILEKSNYSADAVHSNEDVLIYLNSGNYDIIVVDIISFKPNGITALKKLRETNNQIPVLILTSKADNETIVSALDNGANYYLTKPVDTKLLLAVIRTLIRSKTNADNKLSVGNITLDRSTYKLSSPNGSFRLANKEFQMMEIFMSNPQHIISAERFMERIWGYENEAEINVVWVYIAYLRKKLTALGSDISIKSFRNAGYSLEEKS